MTSAASPRHHHHYPVRRAAAGLGGLGTMLLLNTARAFLVRLPLSFGPPIAHPYQPAVRWLGSAAAPPALGAATTAAAASSSSADGSSTSSSTGEGPTTTPITPVKLPAAVSPSSLGDFKTCPRLYRFRHVERVPEPASEVMVRGSMVHDALDQLFLQPPANRTEAVLHDLFRAVWLKRKDKYAEELFPTVDRQRAFGLAGLKLLSNYYKVESPAAVEPLMREHRMRVSLAEGPTVTGILDRVDEQAGEAGGGEQLVVVDYKTGKAPALRYSESVNKRIISDKFFQLKVYALLLHETTGRLPVLLKLIYLDGPTVMTMRLEPGDVDEARRELTGLWDQICAAAAQDAFPTKPGKICDWCSFKSICPAWSFPQAAAAAAAAVAAPGAEAEGVAGPEADIVVAVEQGSGGSGGVPQQEIVSGDGPVASAADGGDEDDEEDGPSSSSSSSSGAPRRGRKAGSGGDGGAAPAAAAGASAEVSATTGGAKTASGRKKKTAAAGAGGSGTSATGATTTATTTRRRRKTAAAAKEEGAAAMAAAAVAAEEQEQQQQQQQQQLLESFAAAAAVASSLSAPGGKVAEGRA